MRFAALVSVVLAVLCLTAPMGLSKAKEEGNPYEPLKRFSQVLDMVERFYVRDVPRQDLVNGAVKGMLQELDPHSSFMNKEEFGEMQVKTSGEFSGIGIEISIKNGRLIVVSPFEDTPAEKAGLKAGDVILEIDGAPTQDITLVEAVKRIRGKRGTEVVLTILRGGTRSPEKVSLIRDVIPIVSVKTETLENGFGYVRITNFNEHTTEELKKGMEKVAQANKSLKGIVLDLRNNPGGLLDQAVSVADMFLSDGLIVYIQGKDPASRKDFKAKSDGSDIKVPVVVLINAGTASASEIVAGALQDHKRAILVGDPSFGKGSVQTIIPLAEGAGMKLTTALYYTPSGRSIQADGIKPNLQIPLAAKTEETDSGMSIVREKDLSGHLKNGVKRDKKAETQADKVKKMLDTDNQLRLALKFLKNPNVLESAN